MDATVIGENEDGIGVDVTDNQGTLHEISIEKGTWEIVYHEQDGYSDDPDERTGQENFAVRTARNYAKWYVDEQTDHDTLPWHLDADRVDAARQVLADRSDAELDEHFDHYRRQLAGEHDPSVDQPRPDPVPQHEAAFDYVEYKLDVYLTDDGDDLAATSGVHVLYYAGVDDDRVLRGDDPFPDRTPHARLEHPPFDLDESTLRQFLDYHLRCQIRDCYLATGREPPEEFRVLGPGHSEVMLLYMHLDGVPEYHRYDASVDGYRVDDAFNMGAFAKLLDLL